MDVIPIHSPRARRAAQVRRSTARVVPIDGTFHAPSAAPGTLSGFFRLDRVVETRAGLAVAGVFAGELTDAAGRRVGLGSRRGLAPVRMTPAEGGNDVLVGPVEIDLMGLKVHVGAFRMQVAATRYTAQGPAADEGTTSEPQRRRRADRV